MSEPTLAVQWKELKARVGLFIGWGQGADYGQTAWTDQQAFEIDGIVASGLRRFYFPPALEGEAVSHKWTFLRPTASLVLPSGAVSIPLPDDYGGFEGQVTVQSNGTTAQPWEVKWVSEPLLREKVSAYPSMQGPPMLVAEAPVKGTSATAGQRKELHVFPTADQAYTLQVQYYVNPDYLTAATPYAYGGAQHAETILESVLAVAEERLDDMPSMTGPHGMAFKERLRASVGVDRSSQPQRFGYNRDRSDDRQSGRWNPHWWAPPATYNGQSFD
jgi:hypothetical protein